MIRRVKGVKGGVDRGRQEGMGHSSSAGHKVEGLEGFLHYKWFYET